MGFALDFDLVLRLSEAVGVGVLDALIAVVIDRALRRGRRDAPTGHVRIYGPDGKVLRSVEIDDVDAEAPSGGERAE